MKTTICILSTCALAGGAAASSSSRAATPSRGASATTRAAFVHVPAREALNSQACSGSNVRTTQQQQRTAAAATASAAAVPQQRIHRRSTVVANLDLKPAFNVFEALPSAARSAHSGGAAVAVEERTTQLDASKAAPYPGLDPFEMVKEDLSPFTDSIKELVDTQHPVLSMAAKHFFERRHGKRFRPTIVCLMSRAVSDTPHKQLQGSLQYARQGQLGTITEMIHVASLIHDDVLDEAEVRRGGMAVHKLYSNKVAVLAGDYLLARASVSLARLNNVEVVEIMATALDSLVQGEIMQLQSNPNDLLDMRHYLKKSYYKTASLICSSCKSAALLGGHSFDSAVASAAEEYGYHMGLAFQIIDDILDVTQVRHPVHCCTVFTSTFIVVTAVVYS
jgi:geranylgeranyl pyrophosphate synthase